MKNFWTAKDIRSGMLIIRESSPKNCENLSFACTVAYKIGFGHFGKECEPSETVKYKTDQQYCLISVLTDGMVFPAGFSKEDVAEHLNKDDQGYRPLTIEEYTKLIQHNRRQLFY